MTDKRDPEGSEDAPKIRVIDRRMLSDDERAGKVTVPSSTAPPPPDSISKGVKMAKNLVVYEGFIAVRGPSRTFDLCCHYDYLRIDTAQGDIKMVKKVVAPHLVDSLMVSGGVHGRFVFAPTRRGLYLVGIRSPERIINASAEARAALGSEKRTAAALLVMGCMFALFIIGIPIIVFAMMILTTKIPSHEEVQRALQA